MELCAGAPKLYAKASGNPNRRRARTRPPMARLSASSAKVYRNWSYNKKTARPAEVARRLSWWVMFGSSRAEKVSAYSMTWSDEELVARSIGGDPDSFNQLVLRWERPIYALAYRVIGREEDARDVCQETFLRAFRALNGFRGQAKFSSWLYRIALNLCRDWMRRQRRAPTMQMPEGVDPIEMASERGPVESIETLVERRELSGVVEQAMALLP